MIAYNKSLEKILMINIIISFFPFLLLGCSLIVFLMSIIFVLYPFVGEECHTCNKKVKGFQCIKYLYDYFLKNKQQLLCSNCQAKYPQ